MSAQVEVLFRREWGRAVAVLARLTGDIGLAEDAVQEAFAAAVGPRLAETGHEQGAAGKMTTQRGR